MSLHASLLLYFDCFQQLNSIYWYSHHYQLNLSVKSHCFTLLQLRPSVIVHCFSCFILITEEIAQSLFNFERESTDEYWETLFLLFYVYLSWLQRYRKRRCTCFVASSIMARWSPFCRTTWNSSRCNFVGRPVPGVRPEQTNTDLSRWCLEESGFRMNRVALAATGCSSSADQQVVPFFSSLARRHLLLHLDITIAYFYANNVLLGVEDVRITV